LDDPVIEREFEVSKLRHHVTRNRFTKGSVCIHGHVKPYRQLGKKSADRKQIQPTDFLSEQLIPEGLQTTRRRKEFLDALLAGEDARAPLPASL
jgi:hypothetical protein